MRAKIRVLNIHLIKFHITSKNKAKFTQGWQYGPFHNGSTFLIHFNPVSIHVHFVRNITKNDNTMEECQVPFIFWFDSDYQFMSERAHEKQCRRRANQTPPTNLRPCRHSSQKVSSGDAESSRASVTL